MLDKQTSESKTFIERLCHRKMKTEQLSLSAVSRATSAHIFSALKLGFTTRQAAIGKNKVFDQTQNCLIRNVVVCYSTKK